MRRFRRAVRDASKAPRTRKPVPSRPWGRGIGRGGFRIAILLLILGVDAAVAYTIVLRDGTTIVAQEKHEVQGGRALITLLNGSMTVIDLVEIDVTKTEEANSGAVLGDAMVLTDRGTERLRSGREDPNRSRTLQDLIQERRAAEQAPGDQTEDDETQPYRTTAAGFPDLPSLRRTPLESSEMSNFLSQRLEAESIHRFRIYRGTAPRFVFVELVAGNADEVFAALESMARITMDTVERYPRVEGLEVLMTSMSRSRAGQFLFTARNAPLLANARLEPADFFLEYVQY